jgi:hypothetical protein
MASIFIRLQPGTRPADKGAALKEICSITALFNVQPAYPDGAGGCSELFYKADVAPGASLKGTLDAVSSAPFVAAARLLPPGGGMDG